MFYIYELALRNFFLFLSFSLTSFICYTYRKDLFFILLLPSFQTNHPITHLIFTNPVEVFKISIFIVLLFTFVFWLPYLLWNCLDFLRPALYTNEVKKFQKYLFIGFFLFLFGNLSTYYFCLPTLWDFFSSFEERTQLIDIVLELKAESYFDFIFDTLLLSNFLLFSNIFFFLLLLKISNLPLIQAIISFKKFVYVCFLLIGTLLTPPDIFSQILVFSILIVLYEFLCFCLILYQNLQIHYRFVADKP